VTAVQRSSPWPTDKAGSERQHSPHLRRRHLTRISMHRRRRGLQRGAAGETQVACSVELFSARAENRAPSFATTFVIAIASFILNTPPTPHHHCKVIIAYARIHSFETLHHGLARPSLVQSCGLPHWTLCLLENTRHMLSNKVFKLGSAAHGRRPINYMQRHPPDNPQKARHARNVRSHVFESNRASGICANTYGISWPRLLPCFGTSTIGATMCHKCPHAKRPALKRKDNAALLNCVFARSGIQSMSGGRP
jgi:hypothetical protein